ncbi:ABC transporter permease [Salinicola endophyticus]|uniref:Transport permease protein n=1 Tax=Salinicola endophyticus TaxID=1949083 RepID=A0ABY8FN71_9GAMM|nr:MULTISPECIES: ABC transporter permease [Salinicola]WFF42651.1 ABC transporter permease [Salinicola endophyticus]
MPSLKYSDGARHPVKVTWDVWSAMFLREMISRTMSDRMAWFWMIFEPIATIGVMVLVRTYFLSGRHVAGADFIPWMVVGLMGFYLFRENMTRPMSAIDSSKGLFTYRQILPIDPVLVRCYVEGSLRTFVFLVFILIGELLGLNLLPDFGLGALFDWFSLWCLGIGLGVFLSAAATLVSEIGRVVKIISLPLLISSCVIIPISYIPHGIQKYVLLNPIVHGIESMRLSFFSGYHTASGVDLSYLWVWALASLSLGLLMHKRFEYKLKAI